MHNASDGSPRPLCNTARVGGGGALWRSAHFRLLAFQGVHPKGLVTPPPRPSRRLCSSQTPTCPCSLDFLVEKGERPERMGAVITEVSTLWGLLGCVPRLRARAAGAERSGDRMLRMRAVVPRDNRNALWNETNGCLSGPGKCMAVTLACRGRNKAGVPCWKIENQRRLVVTSGRLETQRGRFSINYGHCHRYLSGG